MTPPITEWASDDRPREKLWKNGEQSLSNAELLAILLRTGVKGRSALDLARDLLFRFKTFQDMGQLDALSWSQIKGLGPAKIAQIRAALEIGRRFREDVVIRERPPISSSAQLAGILIPRLRDRKTEVVKVVYLDSRNRIILIHDAAQGTVNQAMPILREIFHTALQHFAVSLICAHNHPSGQAMPSAQDESFTRKLVEAGRIMQVSVLDHIIIAGSQFYSFADEGRI